MRKLLLPFFVACGVLLTAYSSQKSIIIGASQNAFQKNYCAPTIAYEQDSTIWKENTAADLTKTLMSGNNQTLCKILGITQPVAVLYQLKDSAIAEKTLKRIVVRQKIYNKILLAQSQIAAVSAELDCEGERSDMAANYLDEVNDRKTTRLTVASVIIGALTTVATGIISNNAAEAVVGISGGLTSAGLGAMTINPKGKKVTYLHNRNLLHSIWTDTLVNGYFPYTVWLLLHEKSFSNSGDITLRQSILNRWIEFNLGGTPATSDTALLFGQGGMYTADLLHTRSSMINQLQATIRSLNQNLTSLVAILNTSE